MSANRCHGACWRARISNKYRCNGPNRLWCFRSNWINRSSGSSHKYGRYRAHWVHRPNGYNGPTRRTGYYIGSSIIP